MSESNTFDINAQCLPLGKAKSVLELLVEDLPCDQGNGVYVAMDLIDEAIDIANSFTSTPAAKPEKSDIAKEHPSDEKKESDLGEEWVPHTAESTTILLNEVLAMVDAAKGLLHAHVADLAGPEAYREHWNKEVS